MTQPVDSFRFLDVVTKKMVKTWIANEPVREIPWTGLPKPTTECTVAIISSGGIALEGDEPFDQEGERQNPFWGDPSHRVIPRGTQAGDVAFYHLHVDASFAREDLNCLLPLGHLEDFEEDGVIGRSADHHYSFMGYILDPTVLIEETTPKIIEGLKNDQVDLVLLVPS